MHVCTLYMCAGNVFSSVIGGHDNIKLYPVLGRKYLKLQSFQYNGKFYYEMSYNQNHIQYLVLFCSNIPKKVLVYGYMWQMPLGSKASYIY